MTFDELRELIGALLIVGGLLNIFNPGRGHSIQSRPASVAMGALLVLCGLANVTVTLQESLPGMLERVSNATVVIYVIVCASWLFIPNVLFRSRKTEACRVNGEVVEQAHHVITEAAFDVHHSDAGPFSP